MKPKRHVWSWVDEELLRRNYADSATTDLCTVIGCTAQQLYSKARRMGLQKSPEQHAEACRRKMTPDHPSVAHRFKPGLVPANKGLRRPGWSAGNMAATQFKKGQRPHNEVPIGSHRVNSDGFLEVKLTELPGPYYMRWKPVHRLIWEEAHGPIPKGHVVAFKPGRKSVELAAITLDALELITLAENMRRNSIHTLMPPELVEVTRLRALITRQINKRSKGQGHE